MPRSVRGFNLFSFHLLNFTIISVDISFQSIQKRPINGVIYPELILDWMIEGLDCRIGPTSSYKHWKSLLISGSEKIYFRRAHSQKRESTKMIRQQNPVLHTRPDAASVVFDQFIFAEHLFFESICRSLFVEHMPDGRFVELFKYGAFKIFRLNDHCPNDRAFYRCAFRTYQYFDLENPALVVLATWRCIQCQSIYVVFQASMYRQSNVWKTFNWVEQFQSLLLRNIEYFREDLIDCPYSSLPNCFAVMVPCKYSKWISIPVSWHVLTSKLVLRE